MAVVTRALSLLCLASVFSTALCAAAHCDYSVDRGHRVGGDYHWIALPASAALEDCAQRCCEDARCRAFSFNTSPDVCSRAPKGAQQCCSLKDTVPPLRNHTSADVTTGRLTGPPATAPKPSARQLEFMDMGLTQFMHFSVTTFAESQHDCVHGNECFDPMLFNPTQMGPDANGLTATDQWAKAARDMGAGEICLTAHHEGGFALWPSQYSNYSVMASKYKHDIVKDFVASCKKYNIRPCFYIGPNSNGYFNQSGYSPRRFYEAQMGMIEEVLTNYGFISRLWWDHYMRPCGGLSQCPKCDHPNGTYCFPQAWDNFTSFARRISPQTLLGRGPDVGLSGGGESGIGDYPVWNADNTTSSHTYGPVGTYFRPREVDGTILNPGDKWFWEKDLPYWNASEVWYHIVKTVGRGQNLIFNLPPDTTGRIPAEYVAVTNAVGAALNATFRQPLAEATHKTLQCGDRIEIAAATAAAADLIVLREDMLQGQSVAQYMLEISSDGSTWRNVTSANGQTIGSRVWDFLPEPTVVRRARLTLLRCAFDSVFLRQFALFKSHPPA